MSAIIPRIILNRMYWLRHSTRLFGVCLAGMTVNLMSAAPSTCGLPRLSGSSNVKPLSTAKYQLWAGAQERVGGQLVKSTPRETTWSVPLRVPQGKELYVSITLTASLNTEFNVGDWRFRLGGRPGKEFTALEYDRSARGEGDWVGTGVITHFDSFGGLPLAALPVLTLRFERGSQSVDLYANMTPLCTLTRTDGQRPFGKKQAGAPQEISVRGGLHGALISGLVQSDENPLYPDDNADGVDDEFEAALMQTGGGAREPDIKSAWRRYAFMSRPPTLSAERPVPSDIKHGGGEP